MGGWWMPVLAAVSFLCGVTMMGRGIFSERLLLALAGPLVAISGVTIPMSLWCVAHHWQ